MNDGRYISPDQVVGRRLKLLGLDRPAWDIAVLSCRGKAASHVLVDCFDAQPAKDNILVGLGAFPEVPLVYVAEHAGRSLAIITRCIWGGPQASMLVEELAYLGVHMVIGYGAAGSIHDDLRLGHQVVATAGVVTDGTSRQYYPDDKMVPASHKLLHTFQSLPGEAKPVETTAATVDAFYRETPALVARCRQLGASVINMETTPLYAAARTCGVEALWLGHVSDVLSDGVWHHAGFHRREMSAATAEWCRRLVEAL